MLWLDMKCSLFVGVIEICLFTFSEGQKYEIMANILEKSPKFIHRIIDKIHTARKHNSFDYNYEDWEEKAPDYLDFALNASVTTSDWGTITQATDLTSNDTILTNQTDASQDAQTISTNKETFASHIPEYLDLTEDIFKKTTTTVTTTSKPRINRILNELIQVKQSTGEGFYTAAMIVALNKLSEKELDDIQTLMGGLHVEVGRVNNVNKMAMLGPIVQQTFTSMAYLATTSSNEVIKLQSQYGVRILLNRKDEISPDWNAIMDVADTIYGEEDLKDIAHFLRELQDYPKIEKDAIDLASDALDVFIFKPYGKIEGTSKDKLLRLELQNAVEKRLGGRRQAGGGIEVGTSNNINMKEIVKFDDRTKEQTSSTIFMEYARNATIMKRLRHRMKLYKEKFRIINKKERGSSRRGPTTTTTTTTTTTPKPPMRKSKYYIRKYVKKDLYKMTTTTKKTTTFRIRYYGKIRKFNIDGDNFDSNHTKTDSDNSEGYYSDAEYNNDERADISLESVPTQPNNQFKTDEIIPLNHDTNKKIVKTDHTGSKSVNNDLNTDKKLKKISLNKRTNTDNSIDEEDYLKTNIRAAMMHGVNFKTNNTRKFVKDLLKDDYDSVSDYEVEIKRNIYKAMNLA